MPFSSNQTTDGKTQQQQQYNSGNLIRTERLNGAFFFDNKHETVELEGERASERAEREKERERDRKGETDR